MKQRDNGRFLIGSLNARRESLDEFNEIHEEFLRNYYDKIENQTMTINLNDN